MIKVSPSLLAADFSNLQREIEGVYQGGADMLHLDVMDGKFVTNISFGLPVIQSIRKVTDIVFDVHLMIDQPERYIERFISAGADIVTFHLEATEVADVCIDIIKKAGKKVGISIKPNTPAEAIYPYLDRCDLALVMTVEPGYGGQSIIKECLEKVTKIKAEAENMGLEIDIQVDGGINLDTAKEAVSSGANVLVAGSAVFGKSDVGAVIKALKQQ